MSNKTKQWGAILVMIALFAMIAFVTNLCSPMAVIVKNQFGASNFLSQIGNYGNFMAYLVMGVPSGILIKKMGYKKTALLALIVGIVGILVQWLSGSMGFAVYLIGAFNARSVSGMDADTLASQIKAQNEAMQKIAKDHRIYYIDLNDDLCGKDGLIDESYVWGGYSLNPDGAQKVSDLLSAHTVTGDDHVKKICQ